MVKAVRIWDSPQTVRKNDYVYFYISKRKPPSALIWLTSKKGSKWCAELTLDNLRLLISDIADKVGRRPQLASFAKSIASEFGQITRPAMDAQAVTQMLEALPGSTSSEICGPVGLGREYDQERRLRVTDRDGLLGDSQLSRQVREAHELSLSSQVEELGVEALAWYRSYHWTPASRWGIYIRLDALIWLAQWIMRFSSSHAARANPEWALCYAMEILHQHEIFHFFTDSFATMLELVTRRPCYIPYNRNIYKRGWPTCPEEALANRYVLETLDQAMGVLPRGPAGRNLLEITFRSFFDTQPRGYRDYVEYLGPRFQEGRLELCNLMAYGSKGYLPIDQLHAPIGVNPLRDVPLYLASIGRMEPILRNYGVIQ